MINILNLSHTDIIRDSRILKEMKALVKNNRKYKVTGIGMLTSFDGEVAENLEDLEIYALNIVMRNQKWLPRKIRHILTFIELTIKMFFKAMKLQPKIIHCHDNAVLHVAILVKLFLKTKLIYDAHELESNRNGLSKFIGKLTYYQEKVSWKYIDAFITVSHSIEQWYKKEFGDKESELILNSPVLVNKEQEKNNYLRDYFKIDDDKKIFLYIGALRNGRGIEDLIEVFSKNDVSSHIVFLGFGVMEEELRKIAQTQENIHVHQAVAHERVVSIAKSADIGLCFIQNVSLSDYYSLPNKLFEYCFSEIPVLASDFPDIKKIVTKYHLGKCSSLNEEDMYHSIKEFESLKDLPKINSNSLYELGWQAQEKKLIQLYEKIIKNGDQ